MDRQAIQSGVSEAIGTFALTFISAGALCTDVYSGGQLGLLGIAMAQGLILAAVVTGLGHVSGAHVNPAVTLGALLAGAIEPLRAGVHVAAQIVGAVLAGLILRATFASDVWGSVALGTPQPGPGVTAGTAIFLEVVLSFLLVFVFLQAAVDRRTPRHLYGLAIGATLTAAVMAGGPLTGAALNPARAFGPALASGTWTVHYVYWIGPLLGGVLAALAAGLVRDAAPVGSAESEES